jgi:hypothetical protein
MTSENGRKHTNAGSEFPVRRLTMPEYYHSVRAIELASDDPDPYFNRAGMYSDANDLDRTIRDFRDFMQRDPGFTPAREALRRLEAGDA